MRRSRLASASIVSLACAACSSETVARPPPPPVHWQSLEPRPPAPDAGKAAATAKERALAEAYTHGVASPAFAKLTPALDEDAHFAFAGFKDVHGRALVVQAHEALFGAYEPRAFALSRVLLTDSSQVLEWTMTGVHKATKKPVGFRGLTLLWTRDDGAISDVHVYFDDAVPRSQLGAGPKGMPAVPLAPPPASARQDLEQANTPEEKAGVAEVRAALEALENGDEAAYLATMTADVEIQGLESQQPLRGKNDARAYFKSMRKAIGNLDTQIDNVWGIGSFAVVEYHVIGEQRGPVGWVPPQKDTLVKMFTVDVVELRDGKIARVWRYDNPGQILVSPDEVHK